MILIGGGGKRSTTRQRHILLLIVSVADEALIELGKVDSNARGVSLLVALGTQPDAIKLHRTIFNLGVNVRVVPSSHRVVRTVTI